MERKGSSSFIDPANPNIFVRILGRLDIFSFIPVPKDDPVSTRQSLIGSGLFLSIFLTYVIYDFVVFVRNNPPLQQSFRTPLDDSYYKLPSLALGFMTNNPNYDATDYYNDLFTYEFTTKAKTTGSENSVPVKWCNVTYINQTK